MGSNAKKKRVRVWTSEDRAAHRIFERERREAFNDSLIDLARRVPSLAGTRRLNKHMIVDHSIARLQSQREAILAAIDDVQSLIAERDQLLTEVNQWRSASGTPFTPLREARPLGDRLQALMDVRDETFATFPNGFGDNPTEGTSEDEHERGFTSDELGAAIPLPVHVGPLHHEPPAVPPQANLLATDEATLSLPHFPSLTESSHDQPYEPDFLALLGENGGDSLNATTASDLDPRAMNTIDLPLGLGQADWIEPLHHEFQFLVDNHQEPLYGNFLSGSIAGG